MEKKTIGAFIAALRKANGMTQKDLAERLNVSDKTVSRWERDDGDPDLSIIPVLAEIFGVTCDELLRGERKSPEKRCEQPQEYEPSPKGEKQRQRLLKNTLSRYQSGTYIAMGISVVGFIAAMIGNLAFLRAVLGFLLGAIFFTASIVAQALFVRQAMSSVEDAELDPAELSAFKWQVIRLAERSIGLTAGFIGFTFPLLLVDAYMGLGADSLLLLGIPSFALFVAIAAVVCYFLNANLLRKGVYTLEPKAEAVYWKNHELKRNCAAGVSGVLAATLLLHAIGSETIWSAQFLAPGKTFTDYESFVAYMEQDVPYESSSNKDGWFVTSDTQAAFPSDTPQEIPTDKGTWYDEEGNVVTEDEARTRTITDANGNVVCTYIHRNESVTSVRYSPKDGSALPITVFSEGEYQAGRAQSSLISAAYCILYPLELAAAFIIYFRKRAK